MTYENGILRFTINHMLDGVFYSIQPDHPGCISDDIIGDCACYYDVVGPVSYDTALHIENLP